MLREKAHKLSWGEISRTLARRLEMSLKNSNGITSVSALASKVNLTLSELIEKLREPIEDLSPFACRWLLIVGSDTQLDLLLVEVTGKSWMDWLDQRDQLQWQKMKKSTNTE